MCAAASNSASAMVAAMVAATGASPGAAMNGRAARAILVGVVLTGLFGAVHVVRQGVSLALVLGVVLALVVFSIAYWGGQWLSAARQAAREKAWDEVEGQHHQFAGVRLRVEEHGRQMWLGAEGLRRALGATVSGSHDRDSDDVLAARHAGHWRRAPDGTLMLRVDNVVQRLAKMPEREDPRVQRLRRYLERDVLFPAQRRREAQTPPKN